MRLCLKYAHICIFNKTKNVKKIFDCEDSLKIKVFKGQFVEMFVEILLTLKA